MSLIPVLRVKNKDGSVMGGVLKILFAIGLFQQRPGPGRCVLVILVTDSRRCGDGRDSKRRHDGRAVLILSVFGFHSRDAAAVRHRHLD